MTKLAWTTFSGVRPKVDPRLLPEGNAQVADNVDTDRGDLRPLDGTHQIMSLPRVGVRTIYRFGQNLRSSTQHWFTWTLDVDVVKGPVANDTDERTYWTGEPSGPRYTTTSLALGAGALPSASRPLGVPAPATAPLVAPYGPIPQPEDPTAAGPGSETRVYIYTFVTDLGEESHPSAPATVDIVVGQGVTVSGMLTSATNGAVLAKKRIYRAQQGLYLFVAEVPIGTTTYNDTLPSTSLGEQCPSIEWDTPSTTMKALTGGPNGMMAAVDGYTIRFCEPFRPHAWPEAYSQTVDYFCVGLGQFGQSFVVLTTGLPYVIEGVHPGNVTITAAPFYQPCLSKRSIVSTGGEVIWASPDGLVTIGASGPSVLTAGIFTADDWRALQPETLTGRWHEGWYVGVFERTTGAGGFMFRPATQEWINLPTLTATAMFRDTVGDALYLCIHDTIHKFRAGAKMPYTWKSQEVVTPLTDYGVARVTGEYPVTFRLFKNDQLKYTRVVTSDEPFKLPPGLARTWEIEMSGVNPVQGVVLSTTEADI